MATLKTKIRLLWVCVVGISLYAVFGNPVTEYIQYLYRFLVLVLPFWAYFAVRLGLRKFRKPKQDWDY